MFLNKKLNTDNSFCCGTRIFRINNLFYENIVMLDTRIKIRTQHFKADFNYNS